VLFALPRNFYSNLNWITCIRPFHTRSCSFFNYSILLWGIMYNMLYCYAFISSKFIEFNRTKFQDIVSPKTLYCLSCLILHKTCPILENFESFIFLFYHEYPCHYGVTIDDGEEIPCPPSDGTLKGPQ